MQWIQFFKETAVTVDVFYMLPNLCPKVICVLFFLQTIFWHVIKVTLYKHSAGPECSTNPCAPLALCLPTCLQHNSCECTRKQLEVQHVCFTLKAVNVTICNSFKEKEVTTTVFPFILHPHNCNQLENDQLCAHEWWPICVCTCLHWRSTDPEDLAFPLGGCMKPFSWILLL